LKLKAKRLNTKIQYTDIVGDEWQAAPPATLSVAGIPKKVPQKRALILIVMLMI